MSEAEAEMKLRPFKASIVWAAFNGCIEVGLTRKSLEAGVVRKLVEAASELVRLMDLAEQDQVRGFDTERVFTGDEFDDLRAALRLAKGGSDGC